MTKTNTLIVGQGIAGTLVSFMLYRHKVPFVVIDPGCANTSSRVAAGMFTPISGKRKTIQPIVLQQIPFAIKIYKEIEQLLGADLLHVHNIYQVHNSVEEQNQLATKLANADYAKYIVTDPVAFTGVKQAMDSFEITHSGWVDCELMINAFGEWLRENDALIATDFLYKDLHPGNEGMQYQEMEFDNIIFCEGYLGINNPFFNNETIIPCKGEVLTIKHDQPAADRIIKRNGVYVVPYRSGISRAGSTYQWNNSSTEPDEAGKKQIEEKLTAMLENKYTTVEHRSGIRPTTQSREVIAKQHPEHKGMFMLNGLGTKGVLQGPWWAEYLVGLMDFTGRFSRKYAEVSRKDAKEQRR